MDPIPNIGIPTIEIYNSGGIPYIPYWQITQPYVPNFYPVTNHMGFPIVDIPGCVTMHKDDKYHKRGLSVDKSLVTNDPDQAMTLCPDGSYPTYDAMNYEPEQLTITYEQKLHHHLSHLLQILQKEPLRPQTQILYQHQEDPPCPGPNQLNV